MGLINLEFEMKIFGQMKMTMHFVHVNLYKQQKYLRKQ